MDALIDVLEFGDLSHWYPYWINSDYLLPAVSTSLSLHEFLPLPLVLRQFVFSLKRGCCLISWLPSLLASTDGSLICPLLMLANVGNSESV